MGCQDEQTCLMSDGPFCQHLGVLYLNFLLSAPLVFLCQPECVPAQPAMKGREGGKVKRDSNVNS